MAMVYSNHSRHSCYVVLFLLILQIFYRVVISQSPVKSLPGFNGPLPFELETGYVGVGESENVQLFYYFIKSERNPQNDPLMLWLTGGPGCSALSGLMSEIGPIAFKNEEYNGSIPSLELRPPSWTKVCSIIFLDLPAGTGFSYAKTQLASQRSDWKQVRHAHQFLRKWLTDHHPDFLSNQVYIGGDSYTGIPLPVLVQEISNGNEKGILPLINLKGYVLGNPITDFNKDYNYQIPFAHGMGLISDELYESLKKSCRGEYQKIDPSNVLCLRDVQAFDECLSGIEKTHILVPKCERLSPHPQGTFWRRSLKAKLETSLNSQLSLPQLGCPSYGFLLCTYWTNSDLVRKALHIREGSLGEWKRCWSDLYEEEIRSSFPYHVNLSKKGYRSLIYSGDHDMTVSFLATQAWIRALNYSIVDDWRSWHVKGQVAGYTRTYSNRMTFATVKGGGHTAPQFNPEQCFAMIDRWISEKPL
ncbi:Serine carboxypeptidase [Quillaja saponaria]|uniref:Serine carboxypeptidase n=1 Tax=Quillaja saponaria TaxID=32244 RepID=A0AAD7PSF2_QUISA|nr:Serine carboxypeptidase [Quillaja saponaria]